MQETTHIRLERFRIDPRKPTNHFGMSKGARAKQRLLLIETGGSLAANMRLRRVAWQKPKGAKEWV